MHMHLYASFSSVVQVQREFVIKDPERNTQHGLLNLTELFKERRRSGV